MWFARALSGTASAGLLAFAGDRQGAARMLTSRQGKRLGADSVRGPGHVTFDARVTLAGFRLVGTDHVFRMNSQRMEVFSGMPEGLHSVLTKEADLHGQYGMFSDLHAIWQDRIDEIREAWGGVIYMYANGR